MPVPVALRHARVVHHEEVHLEVIRAGSLDLRDQPEAVAVACMASITSMTSMTSAVAVYH